MCQLLKRFLFSLGLFSFFLSCSSDQVIRRDDRGRRLLSEEQKTQFAPLKKRLALLPFFNEGPYGEEDLGVTATEELRLELGRSDAVLVDGDAYRLFSNSKEVYSGGGFKLIQMSRKAKLSGLNFILYGRIISTRIRSKPDEIGLIREINSYAEAKVEIRLFDVASQKELFNEIIEGYADEKSYHFYVNDKDQREGRLELLRYATRVAVRKFIPKIMAISAKMDWTGRIAKIIGTTVYINAGRESGLQIGDMLKVLGEGKEIYDPETGALMGKSKGEVKGVLEIIDYFGADGSMASLHSGGSITEGDYVQLY